MIVWVAFSAPDKEKDSLPETINIFFDLFSSRIWESLETDPNAENNLCAIYSFRVSISAILFCLGVVVGLPIFGLWPGRTKTSIKEVDFNNFASFILFLKLNSKIPHLNY